jgi:ABC-type antimicrobial peptide transport system permease subunit
MSSFALPFPRRAVAPSIRARVNSIDRDLDVKRIRTMQEIVDTRMKAPRFNLVLLFSFGTAALVLAAIGTYALLSYLVAQRTREIGIRLALGADPGHVRRGVIARGLSLACTGATIGLVATLALGRTVSTLVVGVSPRDPLTLAMTVVRLVARCSGGVARGRHGAPAASIRRSYSAPSRPVTARKDADDTPHRIPQHISRSEACGTRRPS